MIHRRNIIKVLSIAIILTLAVFTSGSLAADKVFPDMKGHWAEKYVSMLVEKGGITGMPDGRFYPEDPITFPQFVKIIIANKYGAIEPVNSHWASGYMQKALDLDIIFSDELGITRNISRFEAVRIVHNVLREIYGEEDAPDTTIVETFEDYPGCKSCRAPYDQEIGQCYVKGIITGKPGEVGPIFDGDAGLTRAESSIIIMKMIDPSLRVPVASPVEL